MIPRRSFITLLGSAAAWPVAARAQQRERMRRIGILMGAESDPDSRARVKALRLRLGELGWSENRNTRIDVVWGAGDADHVRADAAELIRESPDAPSLPRCQGRLDRAPRALGITIPAGILAIADEVIE